MRNRLGVKKTTYDLGCALGGATTGLALVAVGAPMPALPVLLLAGAVCLLAAAVDLLHGRLPVGRRQVDEQWLGRYRGWVYGAGFGYQLGLGVVTIVTSASTFAVLALALLTQSAAAGLLVGLVFGAARALPALLLRRVQTWDDLRAVGAGLDGRARTASRATAGALAAGGAVLLAAEVL